MSTPSNKLLITNLVEFGLSDKEAGVYLALLQLESASVNDIAKSAGVNRSSTYVVLESLKKKGLASMSQTDRGPKYVPASPEMLYKIADDMSRKMIDTKEKIKEILPNLKALYKDERHRPSVRVFEGKEGMKNLYEDAVTSAKGTLMRAFSQPGAWSNLGEDYFSYLREKRISKGIQLKAIYPHKVKDRENFSLIDNKKRLAEFRFLPKDTQPLSADFRIYEDKIALTSDKDEFGIIIENKEIAEAVKFIFDLAWENAELASQKKNK